ncbi:FG-GAP-like repeat-containing protein [Pedobacter heparinus]|uniref:FG-GAP-like repeat-containing protein n=1 Tax=Pedobacter heparinus TaxID=984 RepID=UPI00292E76FE|nr:FG-GAP-like repeat-containing protein [Pedobacter heparinus]
MKNLKDFFRIFNYPYLVFILVFVFTGCSKVDDHLKSPDKTKDKILSSSNLMTINSLNVKLLTLNVGLGASRLYSGSCFANSNPALSNIEFGDFNGDGITDIFSIFSGQWRYSPGAENGWIDLLSDATTLVNLRFGDFNGDGITDVFTKTGSQWKYSSGGTGSWINLATDATIPFADLRFGDFDGDGKTDVFCKDAVRWKYSSGGTTAWINLKANTETIDQVRLGDFDGDGKTDVFTKTGSQWKYSSGAASSWANLGTDSTIPFADLRFGDFDGDGKTDVFCKDAVRWKYSSGATTSWINLKANTETIDQVRFGDLDGDDKTDVFTLNAGEYLYSSGGAATWKNLDESFMLFCNLQSSCVKPLLLLDDAFEELANLLSTEFSGQYGIICLQEVNPSILDLIKTKLGGTWDYEYYSPTGTTHGIGTLSNIPYTKLQLWDYPQYGTKEKRAAIAQKFLLQNKFVWVVNTHLGLDEAERVQQAGEIITRYQTFTSIPVAIVGDFNITDRYRHGSSVTITPGQQSHYDNTIQALINSGLEKLDYHSAEVRPYSFHSWNAISNGIIVDYILWKDPVNNTIPDVSNWRPGPFNAGWTNAICPNILSGSRFASDHNGILLDFNIFGL